MDIKRVLLYLHSTMYLFQLLVDIADLMQENIYIPLCIYFNNDTVDLTIASGFNLHSTMYLFQRLRI